MSAVIGGPDWMPPMGASVQVLAVEAVNIAVAHGSQQFDITSLLQPQMTAIQCYWQSGAGSASPDVTHQVFTSGVTASPVGFRNTTFIANGQSTTTPIVGALATFVPGATITVLVGAPIGAATPIVGSLIVIGISAPPVIIPQQQQIFTPTSAPSGNVTCNGGATTQVLPSAPEGQYYRVKFLSWVYNAAPVAATSITFGDSGSSKAIAAFRADATAFQSFNVPIDYPTFAGISVTNGSAVAGSARVAAELWPA